MTPDKLLADILSDFQSILGSNLVGFYVHGSIAFGCFQWETSDVDFIAVVAAPPTEPQRIALIQSLLARTPSAPPKGIEMSVILEAECRRFRHPTPYELHFSNAHLAAATADVAAYCRSMRGLDPDLAAHFAVIRAVGQTLHGPAIRDLFAPVPREALLSSILDDVSAPIQNPAYTLLNCCRALALHRQNLILSKPQGAQWAAQNLPPHLREDAQALQEYTVRELTAGGEPFSF